MTSQKGFWKKARGDHLLSAILATSIGLTIIIAVTIFHDRTGLIAFVWFMVSMLAGVFIPARFVPTEWIDTEGKIPPHTFWKELLSP